MPRAPPFKETILAWDQAMKNDPQVSPRTRDTYIPEAWRIFRYAVEHDWPMNVKKLEPSHYLDYYQSIQGLASKTQSTYMSAFSGLLKFAGNPHASKCKIDLQPVRGEVHWLERPQFVRLLQTAPNPRTLAAEVVFGYTGIREFELRELRERSLTDHWLIVQRGKRSKGRKIPVDEEFWKMLEPYTQWKEAYEARWGSTDLFFSHPKVSAGWMQSGPLVPYSDDEPTAMLAYHGLLLDPEIVGLGSHWFRRMFGRELYKQGCPVSQIRVYYGHKTTAQTEEYIGINDEMSADAMLKYRPKYREEAFGKETV